MELYVHFPFCRQKCRYCDFASFVHAEDRMEAYADALLREADFYAAEVTEPIDTVYFGGGTPSLLPAPVMLRLIQGLRKRLLLSRVAEWTTEANPGTLSPEWLDTARECGINRISLGMQAAQDRLLRSIGRIHDLDAVRNSVRISRDAGFSNLSLDLIFGLPGQTLTDWQETLEAAFSFSPTHLSAYGLIPEEGTPLYKDLQAGRLTLPEPEEEREMYEMLLQAAAKHGFQQYEISNFALPGDACRHNIGYWTQVPYLGLGVSAASMTRITHDQPRGMNYLRRTNTSSLEQYLREIAEDRPAIQEEEWISAKDAMFETMMLGLRMNQGVSEEKFRQMHGISLDDQYGPKLKKLQQEGLLEHEKGRWFLTRRGMDLQNTALVELMEDD